MISGQLIGSIDDNDVTFPAIALIELCLLPGTGAGNAPGAGAGGQRGSHGSSSGSLLRYRNRGLLK